MPSSVDTQQLAYEWAAKNLARQILEVAKNHHIAHQIERRIMLPLGLGSFSEIESLDMEHLATIREMLKHLPRQQQASLAEAV